jgi:hypothetical protein
MSESLEQEALRVLGSGFCLCGLVKDSNRPFCKDCYFALPEGLRSGLYKLMSEGWVTAWDEARDWLKYNTQRFDRKGLFR